MAPASGLQHPSGPLPVGRLRDPQQRGRLGRKSRAGRAEFGPDDAAAGDADYDWIKYLGEAGPAQESSRRPADGRDQGSADAEPGGLRGAGRRLSRRHGAPVIRLTQPVRPHRLRPHPQRQLPLFHPARQRQVQYCQPARPRPLLARLRRRPLASGIALAQGLPNQAAVAPRRGSRDPHGQRPFGPRGPSPRVHGPRGPGRRPHGRRVPGRRACGRRAPDLRPWPPEIGRPEIGRPDQTISTWPRQERDAPAAEARHSATAVAAPLASRDVWRHPARRFGDQPGCRHLGN